MNICILEKNFKKSFLKYLKLTGNELLQDINIWEMYKHIETPTQPPSVHNCPKDIC